MLLVGISSHVQCLVMYVKNLLTVVQAFGQGFSENAEDWRWFMVPCRPVYRFVDVGSDRLQVTRASNLVSILRVHLSLVVLGSPIRDLDILHTVPPFCTPLPV